MFNVAFAICGVNARIFYAAKRSIAHSGLTRETIIFTSIEFYECALQRKEREKGESFGKFVACSYANAKSAHARVAKRRYFCGSGREKRR